MKLRMPSVLLPVQWILFAALVLPFLDYLRYAPLTDWFSDAVAAGLTALATLLLLFRRQTAELAIHPVELCLWLLAFVLAVELLVLRPPYLQVSALAIGTLGLGAFAASAVRQSVQTFGREQVLAALASTLLIGALLQCCLGLVQVLALAPLTHGYVVFNVMELTRPIGNIGQANQYAHYLGWGLVSACYLNASGRMRNWLFYACAVTIALMMAWNGGRLVIAYGLGMASIAWIWLRRGRGDPEIVAWARAMAIAVLAIAFMQLFISQIDHMLQSIGLPINAHSGAQRMGDAGFGARRRIEWLKAWSVFLEHPVFGVGWGGYAAQSVRLEASGLFGHYAETGLFTNAHNLIFNLLAETGLLGTVVAVGGIVWCLSACFKRSVLSPVSGCVLALAMVTIGHSLFEYPLWYVPFMTGFAIILALSPAELLPFPIRRWLRSGMAGIFSVSILLYVINGYFVFWQLITNSLVTPDFAEDQRRVGHLLRIAHNPLWAYESDFLLSGFELATPDNQKFKLELFERLASYHPYQGTLIKLAILQAYGGDLKQAKTTLRLTVASYPDWTPAIAATLKPYKGQVLQPLKAMAAEADNVYREKGSEYLAQWASASHDQPRL